MNKRINSEGYIEIYISKEGWFLEHRIEAAKKLGRPLKKTEVVHHIDEDKTNNQYENLMVFKTTADHTAFHNGAEAIPFEDVFICNFTRSRNNKCPFCGSKMDFKATMCISCYNKNRSKNIPPKEILESYIRYLPFTQIGKMFNVSDNAVRKWCKKYNLPYRKEDILSWNIGN